MAMERFGRMRNGRINHSFRVYGSGDIVLLAATATTRRTRLRFARHGTIGLDIEDRHWLFDIGQGQGREVDLGNGGLGPLVALRAVAMTRAILAATPTITAACRRRTTAAATATTTVAFAKGLGFDALDGDGGD